MQPFAEVILATLPGARDDEQVEIALLQTPGAGSLIELRQQTWGEGIGWFTQSRVQLEPQQVAELRGVLGASANRPGARSGRLPQAFSRLAPGTFAPRVVHADSA